MWKATDKKMRKYIMTLRYIGEQATFSIGFAAAKASVEQGDNKSLKVLISKGLGPKPIISQYPYGFLMFSDGGGQRKGALVTNG